jgi:diketogulonate reductase-like aldo/keto reductase
VGVAPTEDLHLCTAHIVPIPGTTKRHRLEENLGAAAVELTADDLREIQAAASQITVQGARYPEHLEQMTGR